MIRKYAAFFPFAFFLFILVLGACNFFEPQPIPGSDMEDPGTQNPEKVELTAGPAQSAAYNETEATVTFNGAADLTLTTADFTVTTGGTVSDALIRSNTAYVKVSFAANDTKTAKTYTVGIAAGSTKIKGSATVVITQAADTTDRRVELTAGDPVIITGDATEATVTFNSNGTGGLALTAADFTVTTGGTIRDVLVGETKVLVTVTFAAGTAAETKIYTVGIAEDSTKIKGDATVIITRYPLFSRPASGDAAYTLVEYDHTSGIGVLKTYGSSGAGIQYIVLEDKLKAIFNAIYTPNAPDTTDDMTFDPDKEAVEYTADISEKVLGLFKITIGASAKDDKIELTGTDLPDKDLVDPAASEENLIVIDIGLPGTVDNDGLPTFYIPLDKTDGTGKGTLGNGSTSYAHIRLRVNKGANLVIPAGNKMYIDNGAGSGNSCPEGGFKDGCVEVMAGGKLRDGAFEGFPLGSNAVILNLQGSYLAVGPEPDSDDATGTRKSAYDNYYSGWLIGPDAGGADKPRIKWDDKNAPSDYLEVRPGELAISADVTVQKGLGLIYSVWFIGDTTVTIDVPANDPSGLQGLFANGDFRFYGTTNEAKIIVKQGSKLHKYFLTGSIGDANTTVDGEKTVTNNDDFNSATEVEYATTGIQGKAAWKIN
jgi:hypothetical protein